MIKKFIQIDDNSFFNIFSINKDQGYIMGGLDAQSIEDCTAYKIHCGNVNQSDIFIPYEDCDNDIILRDYIIINHDYYDLSDFSKFDNDIDESILLDAINHEFYYNDVKREAISIKIIGGKAFVNYALDYGEEFLKVFE